MDAGFAAVEADAIWLEHLPATKDRGGDEACIENFQRHARMHGLAGRYCLLYQMPLTAEHDLASMRCFGLTKRQLLDRLAGPT